MKLYGLIGYPLGHSFSCNFFNEKFRTEQTDARYTNFSIPTIEEFPQIIASHPLLNGLNVTIPYKEAVIPFLDRLSDEAEAIGAVNVIKFERQEKRLSLTGYNSDVTGFERSIMPLLKSHHTHALIMGTGGASKAVDYALRRMGIHTQLVSRNRRDEHTITYEEVTPQLLEEYSVIVNCTPAGMYPHTDKCPNLPYHALTPHHLLYDLIYNPECTLFMRKGLDEGATVKNGMDMLRLQALEAWEIWNK